MRQLTPAGKTPSAFWIAFGIILAVTIVRCAVLVLSPLNLYPDEAQYWWWAQTPDFGYFSKPPMIAWIIWISTTLLGNSEWAIRIASPLFHAATSLLVFGIARRAVDARVSLLSAVAYLTVPGISYSSGLISTDVPLLFFWAAALYAFLRACEDRRWRWPVLCGVAAGLGLESKYAMLYFLAGAGLAAAFAPDARRLVAGWRGLVILAIALLLLVPNIVWNAQHGFPTVAHTEANADWARSRYSLASAAGFLIGQLGVFGPILMMGLVAAFWRLATATARAAPELILAAFCLPPLFLILIQSFVAGANANWAAAAYIAATPLAVAELIRWWRGRVLWASFVVNGTVMLVLWIVLVWPAAADAIAAGNAFKREEGWRQLGADVARAASAADYDFIAADNRSIVAELLYYARPCSVPVRAWARDFNIRDHFEMTMRLERGARRVLVAVEPGAAGRVLATFDSARAVKHLSIGVGGGHARTIDLYDARYYRGPRGTDRAQPASRPHVM
ncbi:MAG TPA: glycosyltransferase family 39 protein [Rhizomicrobium sp.]|jgi:4-amino-4-deoxy-L-arabinose transferase-like glycosyltransferase|nr:glycosyltransferase family 39 protein [Rhizomicrobium sp.]